jgi:hypothetical protein
LAQLLAQLFHLDAIHRVFITGLGGGQQIQFRETFIFNQRLS